MTAAAQDFHVPMPTSRSRWIVGITCAGLLHLAVLTGFLIHRGAPANQPSAPPPMALDMAPLPVAFTRPNDLAPVKPQPSIPKPTPIVVKPAIQAPPSPAPTPAVVLPPKPPHKHRPRRHRHHPLPKIVPMASSVAVPKLHKVTAAPIHGVTSQPVNNASLTWQSQILSQIEQAKRYPVAARWHNQQGQVIIRLSIGRTGTLHHASIISSSGFTGLDNAAIAAAVHAAPFPPPPASVPGAPVHEAVAVDFFIDSR